ncbi:MAG: prepilin-type N-terminal cleavage/methylation domain-containing protein [Gammaproteobacteria bacterium]|nr:prepilin-type N-terminal cleavage/methylation domain-containing protein [Gammaproteobacteria bacterium]
MLNRRGFTLMEFLIAMTVSVVVVAGLWSLFYVVTRHSRNTLSIGRLDGQLQLVLASMTRDIRRAGYWANAGTSTTNPFQDTGTDIQVNGSNNCLLLTYDADKDGSLPAVGAGSDDERYGYRLMNNAIQYRPHGAVFSCTAASSNWTDLTDPNILQITAFNVTLNTENLDLDGTGPGTSTISVRSVTISITGQLAADTSVSKTITKTVKVYNDKYNP